MIYNNKKTENLKWKSAKGILRKNAKKREEN